MRLLVWLFVLLAVLVLAGLVGRCDMRHAGPRTVHRWGTWPMPHTASCWSDTGTCHARCEPACVPQVRFVDFDNVEPARFGLQVDLWRDSSAGVGAIFRKDTPS